MRNLKKILALVLALVMSLSLMATAGASSFSDVDDSNPYSTAIDVLDALKVFIGYEDGSFQPTGELTRAEAAVLVYRIATGDVEGKYVENYTYMANSKFNDLDNGYGWAKGYINYCQNAEIIKGTSATTFSPGLKVTGYQLMVMVLRTLGYDKAGEFSDPITWELESARKCEQLGMLKNIPNTGDFGNPAPRAMTAEILFRGLLQKTVKYSVMTPDGYTMDATTLGYQKFTLEEVTGVVMANEYADIHRNFDTNSDGHNQTAPAGVTVLDLGDGEEFNINVTTKLEDLGETRTTYTIENGKANGHELTGIALENPGTDDITYDNGEALTADQFRSYIHGNENQRYLNFGETSGNDTTSIKVTYEAARIIRNYSALTAAAAVTAFMNDFHLDPASAPAVVAAPVTRLGSGSYDVTYTPAATDLILLNGTSAASVSDRAGHVYSIVNHNGTVFYRVEIEPNTTYTELDEAMVRAIFSRASTTNGNNGLVVTGEVYRGTQFVTDYSDANSYETFVDNCINVADDHINANIDRNMRGWWLKIIDNDNDGITDWVFQTRYTVAKVSGVNADTGALTLDTADWRSTTGTTFGAANEAATWEGHNDAVNYNGNNITAVNYDGDTIEVGDVVYYARIDGKNYAWKCDVVTGRVESINRQALTVTLDNDETYTESEVHEHSIATDIASRVANMSGTVTMDLYMDKYGYMAAFSQNINGNFALLTDGWAQTLKNGVDYAVTAWDSTDQVLKQYDVNEGGSLFINPNQGNFGQANSWNRIRTFNNVNCNAPASNPHTDDIHTIVAYKEDDGETARLIPVDTVYDVQRQNGRQINMIDMDKTIPGSGLSTGTIYATNTMSAVYAAPGTLNGTRVRALSNTLYYYVYQSYGAGWTNTDFTNANGLMVKQFTGYAAGANWLTNGERNTYVEDVYVVGTRAEDLNGTYYTANVVVVELKDGFRPNTHKDNEQVFIYNTPTTVTWNTIEEVDAIRGNGANEKLKIDLGVSRTYTEATGTAASGNANWFVPGLYWLHRTDRTDSEGIWAVEHMHHDDIRLAGIYDVGTVFSSDFNLPNDYVQVTDWICAGGATHHVEDANPANLHNVAVTPAGVPVNPVPSAVTNATRRAADTSKFYNLTYSANRFGTATEGTASGVLNQWATQWGDNTAGRVNQVLVRYDGSGNIVYAVSFDHGELNGNYAQQVWRSVLLDNPKGWNADGVVNFFGVTDRTGADNAALPDEEGDTFNIKVDYTTAKAAGVPYLTIPGVSSWVLTNTKTNVSVPNGQPNLDVLGNTWVLSYTDIDLNKTARSYILTLDPADTGDDIVYAGTGTAANWIDGDTLKFTAADIGTTLDIPAYIGNYKPAAGSEDAAFEWIFKMTSSGKQFSVPATWTGTGWDLDESEVPNGAATDTISEANCVVIAEDGIQKHLYQSAGATYVPPVANTLTLNAILGASESVTVTAGTETATLSASGSKSFNVTGDTVTMKITANGTATINATIVAAWLSGSGWTVDGTVKETVPGKEIEVTLKKSAAKTLSLVGDAAAADVVVVTANGLTALVDEITKTAKKDDVTEAELTAALEVLGKVAAPDVYEALTTEQTKDIADAKKAVEDKLETIEPDPVEEAQKAAKTELEKYVTDKALKEADYKDYKALTAAIDKIIADAVAGITSADGKDKAVSDAKTAIDKAIADAPKADSDKPLPAATDTVQVMKDGATWKLYVHESAKPVSEEAYKKAILTAAQKDTSFTGADGDVTLDLNSKEARVTWKGINAKSWVGTIATGSAEGSLTNPLPLYAVKVNGEAKKYLKSGDSATLSGFTKVAALIPATAPYIDSTVASANANVVTVGSSGNASVSVTNSDKDYVTAIKVDSAANTTNVSVAISDVLTSAKTLTNSNVLYVPKDGSQNFVFKEATATTVGTVDLKLNSKVVETKTVDTSAVEFTKTTAELVAALDAAGEVTVEAAKKTNSEVTSVYVDGAPVEFDLTNLKAVLNSDKYAAGDTFMAVKHNDDGMGGTNDELFIAAKTSAATGDTIKVAAADGDKLKVALDVAMFADTYLKDGRLDLVSVRPVKISTTTANMGSITITKDGKEVAGVGKAGDSLAVTGGKVTADSSAPVVVLVSSDCTVTVEGKANTAGYVVCKATKAGTNTYTYLGEYKAATASKGSVAVKDADSYEFTYLLAPVAGTDKVVLVAESGGDIHFGKQEITLTGVISDVALETYGDPDTADGASIVIEQYVSDDKTWTRLTPADEIGTDTGTVYRITITGVKVPSGATALIASSDVTGIGSDFTLSDDTTHKSAITFNQSKATYDVVLYIEVQ